LAEHSATPSPASAPHVRAPPQGSGAKLNRQSDGGYALDPGFFVDFEEQADGARPHEIHLPGGDCTTEIFQ
jgi:hypothetical protein